jgi:hypothetical protein
MPSTVSKKEEIARTRFICSVEHNLAMRCRENYTEIIAMFDLEANKAMVLGLIEVFNGRRLDLLEDVLHPEFRGRGISAFATEGPEIGPGARRKLYEMFYQAIRKRTVSPILVAAVTLGTRFLFPVSWRFYPCPTASPAIPARNSAGAN